MLSGCVSNNVDLAYRPEAGHTSALSTIKPLVLALYVEDQRDTPERDRVATRWKGGGSAETPVTANPEVTLVLLQALKVELENNGHQVRSRDDANSNAAVRFLLRKFWCCDIRILGSFESAHAAATIHGSIEILNKKNERLMWKPISSTFLKALDGREIDIQVILNGVLSEFIRNLARDPSTVDALRRIQREQKESSSP